MGSSGKIKTGIIGAGIFAEANLYPSLSLHFFDDLDRVAICDIKRERAERMAEKYGWRSVYTDYRQMLDRERPDAVFVCLGGKYHPEVVTEIVERGYPVFLEKPSSIDVAGTEKIATAAGKNGAIVQVGHQKRHGLAYNRARQIALNKDVFGSIVQIESKMHGFTVFPTFYTCMLEWQCHNLDLVASFGGTISEIQAMSFRQTEKTGGLIAMLRFENGALGTLAWGTYGGPGQYAERIEILGDRGKGVIVTNAREVTFYDGDVGETWAPDWNPISRNQSHVFNGYVGELRHFIDCVKGRKEPVPSIHDELKTMKWLAEIAEKAGIPVEWAPVSSEL